MDPYNKQHYNNRAKRKLTHKKGEKKGGVVKFFFFRLFLPTIIRLFASHILYTLLSYNQKKKKMTINDHDQFTGLNAVHVAASEGNVKRLVELMDDGAELDVPALGGIIVLSSFTSRSLSLSRDFFFSLMMSLRDDDDDDDDRFFFLCVFVRVFLRGVRGDARGSFLVVAGSSEGEVREREREDGKRETLLLARLY